MGPATFLLMALGAGDLSVTVEAGVPCVDRARLVSTLETNGVPVSSAPSARLQVQLSRGDGTTVVVRGARPTGALERRIPAGGADCAAVERVVVALIQSWAQRIAGPVKSPVPFSRDAGTAAGQLDRSDGGPSVLAMTAAPAPPPEPRDGAVTPRGQREGGARSASPIVTDATRPASGNRGAGTSPLDPIDGGPASPAMAASLSVIAATRSASGNRDAGASPLDSLAGGLQSTATAASPGVIDATRSASGNRGARTSPLGPLDGGPPSPAMAASPGVLDATRSASGNRGAEASPLGPFDGGPPSPAMAASPGVIDATRSESGNRGAGASPLGPLDGGPPSRAMAASPGVIDATRSESGNRGTGTSPRDPLDQRDAGPPSEDALAHTSTPRDVTVGEASPPSEPRESAPTDGGGLTATNAVDAGEVERGAVSVHLAAMGGGSFIANTPFAGVGQLQATVDLGRFGVGLDLGLESARVGTVAPATVSSTQQWGSVFARVAFRPLERLRLDAALGVRLWRVTASVTGLEAPRFVELLSGGGILSASAAFQLWGPLAFRAQLFVSSRFRAERFSVEGLGPVLELLPWETGALAGLEVRLGT